MPARYSMRAEVSSATTAGSGVEVLPQGIVGHEWRWMNWPPQLAQVNIVGIVTCV